MMLGIPATATIILNDQNVFLEPSHLSHPVDLGQDQLAGRGRLGWNESMHPLRDADVYDYQPA
ncbi:MAG: hypothetical protein EOS75_31795 [Mesorhizobium sp.]|nr:MAG: hypothetical protein EOS74_29815 [Mesorhizobium sp.]RWD51448.1 MAG: hypothetical protein EOS75_31795 [Mesorhizobium sp.]